MKLIKLIFGVIAVGVLSVSMGFIGYGIGLDKTPEVVVVERIIENPPIVRYQDRVITETVIVPKEVIVTEVVTEMVPRDVIVEVEVPVYPALRYFDTYDELLSWFYDARIPFDDCDDMAQAVREAAAKDGYYLGEVVMFGIEYNKIFLDHPIPPGVYHALNFTWIGNYGYYVDFMYSNIAKSPEFVRD